MRKTKTKLAAKKKKKAGIHHRIHRHIKKHLTKLKKKRPHVHKALVLMSITLPIVLGAVLFGSSALYYYESYFDDGSAKEKISVQLPTVEDDTVNWKTYADSLSGFSVKYSDRWDDPEVDTSPESSGKYLRKISFDNGFEPQNKDFLGFDVFVYNSKVFRGPVGTDNLVPKNSTAFQINNCDKAEFDQASLGEEDYPAQEVNIDPDNKCFKEAYFFSATKGGYTYNIVPEIGENSNLFTGGTKASVIGNFPKFFEIISTVVFPETESADRVAAPKKTTVQSVPHRTLIRLGRCVHKNDHPRKSKTKKYRHMDEDCCMDPDEWPNPRCQY